MYFSFLLLIVIFNYLIAYSALTSRMASVYAALDSLHGNGSVPSSLPAACKSISRIKYFSVCLLIGIIAILPCPNNCNNRGCCNGNTGVCTCNSDYTGLACDNYIGIINVNDITTGRINVLVGSFTDSFTSLPARWGNMSGYNNGPVCILLLLPMNLLINFHSSTSTREFFIFIKFFGFLLLVLQHAMDLVQFLLE